MTGQINTKSLQIEKSTRDMIVAASIATACAVACLVIGWALAQHIGYNFKIIGELNNTKSTLEKNVINFNSLKDQITELNNEIDLTESGKLLQNLKLDKSSKNTDVLDNALPDKDDRARLFSSLDNIILASVTHSAINTNPADENIMPIPIVPGEAEFSFKLSGSEDALRGTLQNIEKTIRPISLRTMRITGGINLTADISASTYYIGASNYQLGAKGVRP